MKTKEPISVGSAVEDLVLVLACVLIVGTGWVSKTAVDDLGNMQEELMKDYMKPIVIYQANPSARQRADAATPKPASGENLPAEAAKQ